MNQAVPANDSRAWSHLVCRGADGNSISFGRRRFRKVLTEWTFDQKVGVPDQVHITNSEKLPNLDILVDENRSQINSNAVFPDHVRVERSLETPFWLWTTFSKKVVGQSFSIKISEYQKTFVGLLT